MSTLSPLQHQHLLAGAWSEGDPIGARRGLQWPQHAGLVRIAVGGDTQHNASDSGHLIKMLGKAHHRMSALISDGQDTAQCRQVVNLQPCGGLHRNRRKLVQGWREGAKYSLNRRVATLRCVFKTSLLYFLCEIFVTPAPVFSNNCWRRWRSRA